MGKRWREVMKMVTTTKEGANKSVAVRFTHYCRGHLCGLSPSNEGGGEHLMILRERGPGQAALFEAEKVDCSVDGREDSSLLRTSPQKWSVHAVVKVS